jgi:WD40 repeat protein
MEDFHDWLAGTQQSLHHSARVQAVQFSRDGSVLASAGDLVLLWNMATNGISGGTDRFGSPRAGEQDVTSVSISPSLDLAAFGNSESQVRLWSIPREEWLGTLKAYPYATRVMRIAISGDSRLVAAGFVGGVKLWDVSSRSELRELRGLDGAVAALAFSRDGRVLATGDADGNVRLWSIQDGAQIWRRRARRPWLPFKTEVNVVAFSADGRSVAAGTEDPAILVLKDTATARTIDVLGAPSPVTSLAFAPDGRSLAAGMRSGAITIWDLAKGKERRTLTGHTHAVGTLAFAPNGRTLASGSADETARRWLLPEN